MEKILNSLLHKKTIAWLLVVFELHLTVAAFISSTKGNILCLVISWLMIALSFRNTRNRFLSLIFMSLSGIIFLLAQCDVKLKMAAFIAFFVIWFLIFILNCIYYVPNNFVGVEYYEIKNFHNFLPQDINFENPMIVVAFLLGLPFVLLDDFIYFFQKKINEVYSYQHIIYHHLLNEGVGIKKPFSSVYLVSNNKTSIEGEYKDFQYSAEISVVLKATPFVVQSYGFDYIPKIKKVIEDKIADFLTGSEKFNLEVIQKKINKAFLANVNIDNLKILKK